MCLYYYEHLKVKMENTNFIHNKGESCKALKNFTQLSKNHKVHFVTLLKDTKLCE